MANDPVVQALAPARLIAESGLQVCLASVNQIIADVVARGCARAATTAGQLDGVPSHLDLIGMRPSGDRLDHPAVSVVGREVLLRIDPRGVLAENRLDAAALLEEGFQSMAESSRKLSTQLPTVTWLAAWRRCSRRRTSFGSEARAASSASRSAKGNYRRPLIA